MSIRIRNLNQFDREIKGFEVKVKGDHLKLQKRIALDLLRRIVFRTPVDTGRARGNWQVSLGPSNNTVFEDRKDRSGNPTIASGLASVAAAQPFGVITIFNNVQYINVLEGGSSRRQAPNGMVAISLAEVESQF